MSDEFINEPMIEGIKQALDQKTEQLDPDIQAKLSQMRRQVMAEANGRSAAGNTFAKPKTFIWAPAGGMVAALLAVMLWYEPAVQHSPELDDFELLTSDADLEMLDDMEFVAWLMLEEQPHAG